MRINSYASYVTSAVVVVVAAASAAATLYVVCLPSWKCDCCAKEYQQQFSQTSRLSRTNMNTKTKHK